MERKEAIEVIKKNWPDSSFTMLREALETLIPELKEDDGEKIRKYLVERMISVYGEDSYTPEGIKVKDIIAWLEKQSKQKPAEWSREDECAINVLRNIIKKSEIIDSIIYTDSVKEKLYAWLKSLKDRVQPKVEWSEEDERMYQSIIDDTVQENQLDIKQIDWLKSLRFQKKWKPSEELITYLYEAIDIIEEQEKYSIVTALRELLEQLKQL
jgi:hypothetical protein